MARWICCFKECEARELTASEIQDLRRRCRRARLRAGGIGVAAALCFIPFVVGIACAVDSPVVGWPIIIASVIAGPWIFSKVGDRDKLALLYRRAARLGKARSWLRSEAPRAVRQALGTIGTLVGHGPAAGEDDDHVVADGPNEYWEMEERFDRRLERAAGHLVDRFETIEGDGVVLTLEGELARRVIDAYVVEIGEESVPPSG